MSLGDMSNVYIFYYQLFSSSFASEILRIRNRKVYFREMFSFPEKKKKRRKICKILGVDNKGKFPWYFYKNSLRNLDI